MLALQGKNKSSQNLFLRCNKSIKKGINAIQVSFLSAKQGLSEDEISFIESMTKPM